MLCLKARWVNDPQDNEDMYLFNTGLYGKGLTVPDYQAKEDLG